LIVLGCWISAVYAEEVAVVTVPKSGTHLIKKLLELVDEERTYPIYHTDEFYESEALRKQYPKRILLVRDPRDVCLSWVRSLVSGQADGVDDNIRDLPPEVKEHWRELGLNRQLEYVIRGQSEQSKMAGVHPTLICFPLSPYEVAERFVKEPGTLLCKFENLIGPAGGGDAKLQREEVKKILAFLEIQLSDEKLEKVLGELFGGTRTFNKGQIGRWKKAFTRKNKKLFIKRRSHLLDTFGYAS